MKPPLPIGVLVSGEGTTLDALAEHQAAGTLGARIVLVISDRPEAPAIEKARRRGIPTVVIPARGADRRPWAGAITGALEAAGVELVVNAGFLSILPDPWVERWAGRAINLHPSLLPRHGGRGMYGPRVHRAVLESGDRETGATVHLVTSDIDGGPIVAQERMPVLSGDTPETLRSRLHPVEVELLVRTIRRFANGELPLPYATPGGPTGRRSDGPASLP